jgi:hypothetical protein
VIPARRSTVSIALVVFATAMFGTGVCRGAVEVYPGPGADTYKSALYTVEVFDGSSWLPAYVYGGGRKSVCHWHPGTRPTVNVLTFGTTGQVNVRVTSLLGSITTIDVSPHSKNIPVQLTGGQAVLTLNPLNKVWITINGDDANPLFIFADPPKPPVPAGATYFGPGITTVSAPGNHYKAANNEIIYLDGGAWVRGNFDIRGTRNVQIMGPGILSGDLWAGEDINPLPFNQFLDYSMIEGDWFGGDAATVSGITIVDSPGYNFFSGATRAYDVKILSPWFFSTDGFQNVSHIDQSFVFNGDNAFTPGTAGLQNENVTITSSFAGTSNNSVFTGGYYGFEVHNGYTAFVDDIDVKTYNNDDWVPAAPLLASVFQVYVDNNSPVYGYANQTYQNVRVEGNLAGPMLQLKNIVYPWGGIYAYDPPLGNSYNFTFRNISLEGTQKYRSEIKGWDASDAFHNVVLENVRMAGTVVNASNVSTYFDVRNVSGLYFTTDTSLYTVAPCRIVDTRSPPGGYGGPALAAGQGRTFSLAGQCGLPAGIRAVSVNVTVTKPSTSGYLTLYPGGPGPPLTSTINYRAGQTRANNAIVPVGGAGEIIVSCGQASGSVQFILDVNAYLQ